MTSTTFNSAGPKIFRSRRDQIVTKMWFLAFLYFLGSRITKHYQILHTATWPIYLKCTKMWLFCPAELVMRVFQPMEKGTEKQMYGTDFWISSRGQLRNRTKLKIIGFSKTARWNSLKINGRSQFLIYFHLQS